MTTTKPRFEKGDIVTVAWSRTYGRLLQGHQVRVVDPEHSSSSTTKRIIKVLILSADPTSDLVSTTRLIYEDECVLVSKKSSSLSLDEFTVSRSVLESWKTALENSDYGDQDAEGIIESMDTMMNPIVTQEYTVKLTGKLNHIQDVLSDISVSSYVLSDEVTYQIDKVSEELSDEK